MEITIAESPPPPRKKMKIVNEEEEKDETLIPDDLILLTILPRLPIKSALRFQLVSKPWRNFIKHPMFTRLHLSLSKFRNPTTFLILSTPPKSMSVNVISIAIDRNANTIHPGRVQYAPLEGVKGLIGSYNNRVDEVIGVCSGVFCVACGYARYALLWNPALREVKAVKYSYSQFGLLNGLNWGRMSCIGFGAVKDGDGNVVNFKLLTMVCDLDDKCLFSVYSLNTNKWSLVESPSFVIDRIVERGWVYLNGVLHWLAWGSDTKKSAFVLTFDIASETFGRIEFPRDNELMVVREWDNFLTVLDGQYLLLAVAVEEADGTCIYVWGLFDDLNKKWWMRAEKMIGPLEVRGGSILRYWADGNAVIAHNRGSLCLHAEGKDSTYETEFSENMTCWEYAETFVSPKRISEQDNFQDID